MTELEFTIVGAYHKLFQYIKAQPPSSISYQNIDKLAPNPTGDVLSRRARSPASACRRKHCGPTLWIGLSDAEVQAWQLQQAAAAALG